MLQIDSDDGAKQVQEAGMIGNINEIIGINSSVKTESEELAKTTGKTSIMTTSNGKTLKRKHDDDALKIDAVNEDIVQEKKKHADNFLPEKNSEITITPIPKASEEKTKDSDVPAVSVN